MNVLLHSVTPTLQQATMTHASAGDSWTFLGKSGSAYEHPQNTRVGPQMWKQRLREGKCLAKTTLGFTAEPGYQLVSGIREMMLQCRGAILELLEVWRWGQ